MKKMQVADEKKSARTVNPGKMKSLVWPEANRLRKNLCQALSSPVKNGLHYVPTPLWVIFNKEAS
ncbi:hypothetical protein Dpoa569_0000928 [Dickeya poaceiphila]|uniref:Uncharacterized protein n=1 Tax=Dickeya poaceiphila TaxID=568768 RepID=A0A5B8I7S0_9GAMM|nr:hypothetical protein Dpoa569_0000928 [Dickeya poaceiphila]